MAAPTFQSFNAAVTGIGDEASVAAAAVALGPSASMIPGQTTEFLNKQLTDTLTGLAAASRLRDNAFVHGLQTNYLQTTQSNLANVVDDGAQRKNNATRQFEINEWATENRQETIFVYQFIFFGILIATIVGGFYRTGLLSGPLASFLTFITIATVVFLIVYRAQFTIFKRDKRHWNKRRFQSAGPILPLPNCPAAVDFVTNLPSNVQAITEAGAKRAAGGLSNVFGTLGSTFNRASAATASYKF
jgi:hypothetical protein